MEIHSRSSAMDGQLIHYLEAGSGQPVVLIHGLLGGSFCWRFNLPWLARRYRGMAVDLPGFGESVTTRDVDCGMRAQADRLAAWFEELGLDSVDVVGSSWGAGVALLLAAATTKVRSLVLAAPVNPWSDLGRDRVRFFSGKAGATLLRMGMPFSRPVHRLALERMYGDPRRIPPGTLEGYSKIILRKGRAHNLVSTLRCWEGDLMALRRAVTQVRTPTLLVWGTRDTAVDIRSADTLMLQMRACEKAIIPGAGHLPFEEAPEQFNRLVSGFLERAPAAMALRFRQTT